ncbi:MAG: epoxyqueuosine reductase QueH [bacterium]|nr:epoxyqueuosine reductase QueH [bacterium]
MISDYTSFEKFLDSLDSKKKLLVHACCGPCSTSVLELLSKYFTIDVLYYNPNIYPKDEYDKRLNELKKVSNHVITLFYDDDLFYELVRGLENLNEGGFRCYKCIEMRLRKTAIYAKENGYDFFTTTLSVSPHKNSKMINEIGYKLEKEYNIKYLYSDFKKKDGYKRSIFLSNSLNLYRQDYCGCKYSIKAGNFTNNTKN